MGKTGFARADHTLRFYAVSRYEEPHKIGRLAENRRFFDKLKPVFTQKHRLLILRLKTHISAALFQLVATLAAELDALIILSAALGANVQRQIRSAIGAKLTLTGWFAAVGAEGRFLFDVALKDLRFIRFVPDIALHLISPRRRDLNVHSWRAFSAQAHFIVPARVTHPKVAFVAAMEMLLSLVLRCGKRFLMLLVPVWRHALKALRDHALPHVRGIAQPRPAHHRRKYWPPRRCHAKVP